MPTQAERIAKIEVHLEGLLHLSQELKATRAEIDRLRTDISKHRGELSAIKNKGVGLILGVALAASFFGAKVAGLFTGFLGIFR